MLCLFSGPLHEQFHRNPRIPHRSRNRLGAANGRQLLGLLELLNYYKAVLTLSMALPMTLVLFWHCQWHQCSSGIANDIGVLLALSMTSVLFWHYQWHWCSSGIVNDISVFLVLPMTSVLSWYCQWHWCSSGFANDISALLVLSMTLVLFWHCQWHQCSSGIVNSFCRSSGIVNGIAFLPWWGTNY